MTCHDIDSRDVWPIASCFATPASEAARIWWWKATATPRSSTASLREGFAYAEAKGYGSILLCLDISDPAGLARLLADPVKSQLPVGI